MTVLDNRKAMPARTDACVESTEVVISSPTPQPFRHTDRKLWRDLVAFWILGLCNNYGYVVMLSAAHDIIGQFHHGDDDSEAGSGTGRQCHIVSTGAILLADVLPSLCVKTIMPFVPLWINIRVAFTVFCAAAGFLLVGFAHSDWMAIVGVIVTSAGNGIGETTILSYSSNYNKNVISTWSSGTGGAGVIGSVSYATLRSLNFSPRDTMLVMLIFPLIQSLSFWGVLRRPQLMSVDSSSALLEHDAPLTSFKEKICYAVKLLKYMLPLVTVYFFEYFINQGLFELVYFNNTFIDKAAQYRWLNAVYQIGVFISRSSVNIIHLSAIWPMSIFQFINVLFFLSEVIYYYVPSIWIVFAVTLWEGLLGGAAYVNTFYRMSEEIPVARRKFAMGVVVQSDSYGVALAGFLAIPVHNAICNLPARMRGIIW